MNVGGVVQIDVASNNWEKVANTSLAGNQDKAIQLENVGSENLTFNTLMDAGAFIRNKQTIPYGSFATVKIKVDSLEAWQLFAGLAFEKTSFGLSANDLYSIILSKDSNGIHSAEMQKYKADKGRKQFLSIVNEGIIKAGEWNDIAIGTIPCEDGTRFVAIVNGKLLYDYFNNYDSECYYEESYFMAHRSAANNQTEYAKSDMTYDDIMAIVKAGKK